MSRYRTQSEDTSRAAEEVQFALLRAMTPARKLAVFRDLNAAARRLAELGIRMRHPGASDREVFLRLAATWLDRETMRRAYGWDPISGES